MARISLPRAAKAALRYESDSPGAVDIDVAEGLMPIVESPTSSTKETRSGLKLKLSIPKRTGTFKEITAGPKTRDYTSKMGDSDDLKDKDAIARRAFQDQAVVGEITERVKDGLLTEFMNAMISDDDSDDDEISDEHREQLQNSLEGNAHGSSPPVQALSSMSGCDIVAVRALASGLETTETSESINNSREISSGGADAREAGESVPEDWDIHGPSERADSAAYLPSIDEEDTEEDFGAEIDIVPTTMSAIVKVAASGKLPLPVVLILNRPQFTLPTTLFKTFQGNRLAALPQYAHRRKTKYQSKDPATEATVMVEIVLWTGESVPLPVAMIVQNPAFTVSGILRTGGVCGDAEVLIVNPGESATIQLSWMLDENDFMDFATYAWPDDTPLDDPDQEDEGEQSGTIVGEEPQGGRHLAMDEDEMRSEEDAAAVQERDNMMDRHGEHGWTVAENNFLRDCLAKKIRPKQYLPELAALRASLGLRGRSDGAVRYHTSIMRGFDRKNVKNPRKKKPQGQGVAKPAPRQRKRQTRAYTTSSEDL